MSKRPSRLKNLMDVAATIAQRSHDAETKVGAVLVNIESGAIISTGYNGFIRGAADSKLPSTRPDKYEYILHAEQNLICNAARHGLRMDNTMLVCTHSPCKVCMRMLINCGVTKVVVQQLYKDFQDILAMKDVKVQIDQDEEGFYHITYNISEATG